MKTTSILTISATMVALIMGFTACKEKSTPISPPMSGLPFVTKYLAADQNTRFDHVDIVTGSEYGKIVIVSDPGTVAGNTIIDPRSGNETQITEYKTLQAAYGDDQVHRTWEGLSDMEAPVVYNACFSQPVTSIGIVCDKEYNGIPAGSSLNSLFSIHVHNIAALVRTYDKETCWGETYNYTNGKLEKATEGVVAETLPLEEWNKIEHRLMSLIPLFVCNELPAIKQPYQFTVTYTFADGAITSFTTPAATLGN